MAKNYVTLQGDTWDKIAYQALGSECMLPLLLEANRQHRKITIFPGGIELTIPEVDTSKHTERPPWLGEDDDL